MKEVTKKDLLLAEAAICFMVECGVSVEHTASSHRPELIFRLMRAIANNERSDLSLSPGSLAALESFQTIHSMGTYSGGVYTEIVKKVLEAEVPEGFCHKPQSRTYLRAIGPGLNSGLSPEAVIAELFKAPELPRGGEAYIFLKEKLDDDGLEMFFDVVLHLVESGGNLRDFCLFVAGSKL